MTGFPNPAGSSAPISRNQLCPCGSGKRYKYCCGSAGETGLPRPPSSGLGDKLRMALQNQLAGKLSLAEQLYREALELDVNNTDALHMLGVVCMERFRYAEALDLLFRAAEQTHWTQPQIRHNLGLVIARLMTAEANARQDLLLAKHLERRKSLASKNTLHVLPLVSVIVPSYNSAEHISDALASVYEQTYRNLELIVIDDGSTDGSPAIIGKSIEGCPFPHRFIASANQGHERTLDKGAELSRGSFLAFLNPEDCFAPNHIEQMVANIAAKGAQWGYSGVSFIDHHGELIDSTHPAVQKLLLSSSNVFGRISNSFAFLEFNPSISTGNLFIEKKLFQRTGGFHSPGYNHARDFCLRASALSEPVFVEDPLYYSRLHDKIASGESNEINGENADRFLADYYRSLEDMTIAENELSPSHADNRILLYKLGLGIGHGKLLPIDRLRSMSMHWLSRTNNQENRLTTSPGFRMEAKQALIVLGMHRSGTSAFSRVLNLCGAFLPDNKHPAKLGDNEKGFWEPQEIPQLNERLFKAMGKSWLDAEFNLADRMYLHADFIDDAAMLLKSEYGNQPLILIKDPRICVLAPWWDEALHKTGYEPFYIIPVRNPLEVAASLNARDKLPIDAGMALWLRYFNEAEAATRDSHRVFVTYTDLMADWKRCLARISATVDVKLDVEKNAREVDSFLEDRLRRQRSTDDSLFNLPPTPMNQAIKEKYRWALQQAVSQALVNFMLGSSAGSL